MNHPARKPNALIHESSPYLLQHAYNPVNWLPYTPQAFEIAKRENKLVLVSIGYSACHWCHVMEHESFEDEEVAALMNRYFVNIKVDREERSDVDMIYMQAVQLMTGHGGWPLNCFVLPNGQPFYGGTYFNRNHWLKVLNTLSDLQVNDPEKIVQYAGELTKGIVEAERLVFKHVGGSFGRSELEHGLEKWKRGFDHENGGPNRAPKFPLPCNYLFLLRYSALSGDHGVREHVILTLNKMAMGGIYDQLRGGFSRYSTDLIWKVPHFEKMLYDNAQLVSLYAEAFRLTKNEYYRRVVMETLDFVEHEWTGPESCFYSAFDADSEGEEGKYYVWTDDELREHLGNEYELFSRYYEINNTGYWEHSNYILMRSGNLAELVIASGLNLQTIEEKMKACRKILLEAASQRVKPGLDDKSICSWNAMMCSAFSQAYLTFGVEKHKVIAIKSIEFILSKLKNKEGRLLRTYKQGQAKIEAFLEDYAFTIEALLNCYLLSQEEAYLTEARNFCEYALKAFYNPESPFLFYAQAGQSDLLTRTTETGDNVIPSSNSQMAFNLFYLSRYLGFKEWEKRAEEMLAAVREQFLNYPPGYSHWASLALLMSYPVREVAIVGNRVDEKLRALYQQGLTNTILAAGRHPSELPLLANRFQEGKTMIYVCRNNTCQLPVESVEAALEQLETT